LFLTFSVSSFIKWNRRKFIANNEWPPIHQTSIHWIIRLGGNAAGVLLRAATEAKNSSIVYRCTLADLVCLVGESYWHVCERESQLTAGMCVCQRWKFWICLGNKQGNFQLHRFARRENAAKSFRGLLFDSHCTCFKTHMKRKQRL